MTVTPPDADSLRRSRGYQTLVSVGLISYGLVHLLVAVIAVRIALGGGGDASQRGALRQLAGQPLGRAALWLMAAGLLTLVVWQVMEAMVRRKGQRSNRQVRRRISAVGRAVVYLALAATAVGLALGSGSSGGNSEQTLSARLMSVPFGRLLVGAVGIAVLAVGISQVIKGVKKKFTEDLRGGISEATLRLGIAGFCAKGVALGIIGLLFGWAAWTYDPKKAGGLDAALDALRGQPFGTLLLIAMAAGIAAFGAYCFVWARNAKY